MNINTNKLNLIFKTKMEMTMSEFKAGDLVVLKSGGPTMTISVITSNGASAVCEWFDSKNNLKEGEFNCTSLERFDPNTLIPFSI